MNTVTLMGRLGKNPETKQFDNGSITNMTVATDESYKNKDGEKIEKTEWHNVSAWGKQGETIAKCFNKGDLILLTGKLQTRTYEKDGEKRYATDVLLQSFEFVPNGSSKKKEETTPSSESKEELPF